MLFTSPEFMFLYLPITLAGFFLSTRLSKQMALFWLLLASLVFYSYWNPKFVFLLLCSATFNYVAGYSIGHTNKASTRRLLLTGSVSANLIVLGVFKYFDFFVGSLNASLGTNLAPMHLILPLGISFFTFTQIAFLVDVHRNIASEYRFTSYLLFVSYFPHLIAGPVLHHKQLMPQFASAGPFKFSWDNAAIGLTIICVGLAKKVLLADSFAGYATPIFEGARDGTALSSSGAWIGALAYTFQIYFDFSGYSDMAIGISRLFGISLPINFNSPYKSHNIIEFWRRWHITLSQFLKDYLYIPLGGNRRGSGRRYLNLMITMLLGGLWHGANWTFFVWGGLHGIYLVINHVWHAFKRNMSIRVGHITGVLLQMIGPAITFLSVVVAWVFFRADSFGTAVSMLNSMFDFSELSSPEPFAQTFRGVLLSGSWKEVFLLFLAGSVAAFACPSSQRLLEIVRDRLCRYKSATVILGLYLICLLVAFGSTQSAAEFIYFNF